MKKIFLQIIFNCSVIFGFCQSNEIEFKPSEKDDDMRILFDMIDFDSYSYILKSKKAAYVNIYINEYFNDSLISKFDHLGTKNEYPKDLYPIVFPKINDKPMKLQIYSLAKSDSILLIRLRVGTVGIIKKIRVDKAKLSYSWKSVSLKYNEKLKFELNKKTDLLYYASAVVENIDGLQVNKFCNIPNILNNKSLISSRNKISHYFILGIELVENIE